MQQSDRKFLNFIGLKAFSAQHQSPAPNTGVGNDSDGTLDTKTSDESVVPWTILNRYYIADVHFLTNVIHGISPTVFDKPHMPPAVIYVWVDGEVCQDLMLNYFIPFLCITAIREIRRGAVSSYGWL